jgi:hypothetical protein
MAINSHRKILRAHPIAFFFVGLLLLEIGAACFAQTVQPVAIGDRMSRVSLRARSFAGKKWDNSSFTNGIQLLTDRKETTESRAVAIEVLHANRMKLAPPQINQFLADVTTIAKDPESDEQVATIAIHTMGNTVLTMKDLGQTSEADSKREARFFLDAATNTQRSVQFRAGAINALGILKIEEAFDSLRQLLEDETSMNLPEISRPACLSLMRVDGERSIPILRQVLRKTVDARVFGTAAFAIGQTKKSDSIVALVENEERFPNGGSCDAALADMEDVVLRILIDPNDPNLTSAIRATRHLWREGQRDHYIPLLRQLLATAPISSRKACLDRLLDVASTKEFDQEKKELEIVLDAIRNQPDLAEYQQRIQRRLSSGVVLPAPDNNAGSAPPALKGVGR